jgi:hypothetical protein
MMPLTYNNTFWVNGTLTVNCGSTHWTLAEAQAKGIDIGSTASQVLPNITTILGWGRQLLGF